MKFKKLLKKTLKLIYVFIFLIPCCLTYAGELENAIEMSASSMFFQAKKIVVSTENIANAHSTSSVPGGNPYRRKLIFATNKYDKKLGTNILTVKKYDFDNKSSFVEKFDPNHPAADFRGYIKMPNVDIHLERADIAEAQKIYEADLGIIKMTRSMVQKTIDAIKN